MATVTYIGYRPGNSSESRSESYKKNFSTSRTYLFECDDAKDGFEVVAAAESDSGAVADGFPTLYKVHDDYSYLRCTKRDATMVREDKGEVWMVLCEYANIQGGSSSGTKKINNVDDNEETGPYNVRIYTVPYEIPMEYAYKTTNSGDEKNDKQYAPTKQIVNTAKDKYASLPTKNAYNIILEFSYNLKKLNLGKHFHCLDTVNSKEIDILGITVGEGKGRINNLEWSFQKMTPSANSFWCVNAQIELSVSKDHALSLDSYGFNALNPAKNKLCRVYTDEKGGYGVIGGTIGGKTIQVTEDGVVYYDDGSVDVVLSRVEEAVKLDEDGLVYEDQYAATPASTTFNINYARDWRILDLPKKQLDQY